MPKTVRNILDRNIPLTWVLAAASVMISVGVAAYFSSSHRVVRLPDRLRHASPELLASLMLDAWRERDHTRTIELSCGAAREAALQRQSKDEHLPEPLREATSKIWKPLADSKLSFRVEESEKISADRMMVRGVAVGTLLSQPYKRRIEFEMLHLEERWCVEGIHFGDILTQLPREFQLVKDDESVP